MSAAICPVTGQPATKEGPTSGDWERYRSAAAGGRYEITRSAIEDLPGHLPLSERPRLVDWLVNQRLSGSEVPRITTDQLELGALPPQPSIAVRLERLLKCLEVASPSIGSSIPYDLNMTQLASDLWSAEETRLYLQAWTSSRDRREVSELVRYAEVKGWIRSTTRLQLTLDGWQRLEELRAVRTPLEQAFVAMWFGDEVADAYEIGIAPAIAFAGYTPLRIDRKEHNNKIDDEIIAEIRRSRFMVADFTCGLVTAAGGKVAAIPRGGVYYEAGFALGLGIPVIWTVRSDHIDHVHFDTRQFNHITWESAEDLGQKLAARIGAVLGDGPLS